MLCFNFSIKGSNFSFFLFFDFYYRRRERRGGRCRAGHGGGRCRCIAAQEEEQAQRLGGRVSILRGFCASALAIGTLLEVNPAKSRVPMGFVP